MAKKKVQKDKQRSTMVLKNNHLISGVKEQSLNHYKYMYVS
jgi:hypothetical protein